MATKKKTTAAAKPSISLRKMFASKIADLGKVRNAGAEARALALEDEGQRVGAANILDPRQVASGKGWTPAKVMEATLGTTAVVSGQQSVALTGKQIKAFKENIKAVQQQFRGGLTARQILDFAAHIDKQRAQREIRVSIPVIAKGGRVQFTTSASLKYKAKNHHVTVEFMSYEAAVAGGQGSPLTMARWLRQEPLKFDCDCGRHKFFYRYISTIGAFNAGRPELGYPKVTNPELKGVACKHVVRTMAEIASSANVTAFLATLIEKGRAAARPSDVKKSTNKITQREMEEQAAKMFKRPRTISSQEDQLAKRKQIIAKKALTQAVKTAPPPKQTASASKNAAKAKDSKEMLNLLAKEYGMTPQAMLALLERNRKA